MSSHNWICQFYWKTFLHSPFYYSFYVIVDAGVRFEVLCAVNKTGKVERVGPPPKVSIDLWFSFLFCCVEWVFVTLIFSQQSYLGGLTAMNFVYADYCGY